MFNVLQSKGCLIFSIIVGIIVVLFNVLIMWMATNTVQ